MVFKKSASAPQPDGLTAGFFQRVLFIAAVIVIAALAFKLVELWLMIFGAIIVATILRVIAEPLIKYCRLSSLVAVPLAFVIIIGALGVTIYLFGREIADQAGHLSVELPAAWAALQARLQTSDVGQMIQAQLDTVGQHASGALSRVPGIASNVLHSLTSILAVTVGGLFLALDPAKYRDGVVLLVPVRYRNRARDSLNAAGEALRLWLLAQVITMVLTGLLVSIGLLIIGVPSALLLGILTALGQFAPFVGPTAAAIPGLILAGSVGTTTFVLAGAVYLIVLTLEANLITPLVQRRVADVPSFVTLFAIIGFALLFGPLGIVFAKPLTVVAYALGRKFHASQQAEDEAAQQA